MWNSWDKDVQEARKLSCHPLLNTLTSARGGLCQQNGSRLVSDIILTFCCLTMSSNWKVNESLMSTYTWTLGASTTMGRCSYRKHFLSVHYLLESMVGAGDTEAKKTQSHPSRNLQDSREMETWNVIIILKKAYITTIDWELTIKSQALC